MKYYNKINLKCSKDIQEFAIFDIINQIKSLDTDVDQIRIKHSIPPDLKMIINKDLESNNLPNLLYAQSYIRKKNTKQGIHIDGNGEIVSLAINIPLKGTEKSRFNWWGGNYKILQTKINDLPFYKLIWMSEKICVETLEILEPVIIRVDQPHNAESSENADRWVFTMRFENNPNSHPLLCI